MRHISLLTNLFLFFLLIVNMAPKASEHTPCSAKIRVNNNIKCNKKKTINSSMFNLEF